MNDSTLITEADLARQRGEFEAAAELYEKALRQNATSLPASAGLGISLHRMARPAEAVPYLVRATLQESKDPVVWVTLGQCYVNLGNPETAISAFEHAIRLEPEPARPHLFLAYALIAQNRILDAEASLQTAIGLDPELAAAHDLLAFILPKLARFEESKSHARVAFDLDPSSAAYGFRFVHAGRVEEADRYLVERLTRLDKSGSLNDRDKIRLGFALGKAREDLGAFRESATHYVTANKLALREMDKVGKHFDAEEHRREVDYIVQGFPGPESFRTSSPASSRDLPVFIVGMMRSGTTLVEQILTCHPQVGGAGEIPYWLEAGPRAHHNLIGRADPMELRKISEEYINLLEARCPGMARVCDKLPQNYMSLGAIHSVFPEARIIHCRRDPKDVCLSLFTTPFGIPPSFAYSAEHIAAGYRQYQKLVRHWKTVLPPDRFLEIDYEDLVTKKELTARSMVEFIGLDWSESCLYPERNPRVVETPSQWQVRQPVYGSSIGRWKRFAEWMSPQFEAWNFL